MFLRLSFIFETQMKIFKMKSERFTVCPSIDSPRNYHFVTSKSP